MESMSKNRRDTVNWHEIEFWWIKFKGSLTIAEVYRYNDLLEAVVAGREEPVSISERDLILEIKKPTLILL
jgi:hypothetical protein